MDKTMLALTVCSILAVGACTPDREGEMGRVDPDTAQEGHAGMGPHDVERERQIQEALAACRDVTPEVSRRQCEAEARRALEGRVEFESDTR